MSAPVVLIPRGEGFEVVRNDHYALAESDVFDGKNRLGMDVSHLPLNVPLCCGCDGELHSDGVCSDCGLIHADLAERDLSLVEVLRHDPNGVWL